MFVIKDNTIEYNTGTLLGSSLNTQGVQLITPPPGIIQYPLSIIDEQILLINNSSLNTIVTSDTNMIYIVNNIDNVDTIDTTTLNNNSNSIILLSSNSFTLSTKVKRAYASMSGVSTTEKGCPCFCHYIGTIASTMVYSNYTSSLELSSSIKSLIQENSTSAFLVNASFLAEPTGSYTGTSDIVCISGFYLYAGDTTIQTISNNSHQSSMTFGLEYIVDVKYINFYESFVTWENIQDIDMYGMQCIYDLRLNFSKGIFYFADPVYYRLEMIVYEG